MLPEQRVVVEPQKGMRRIALLVLGSIVVAIGMVLFSLWLYSRGADQLDLSRPGLVSVRDRVNQDAEFSGFTSSGDLKTADIDAFLKLYDSRTKHLKGIGDFSNEPLSDAALGLSN